MKNREEKTELNPALKGSIHHLGSVVSESLLCHTIHKWLLPTTAANRIYPSHESFN